MDGELELYVYTTKHYDEKGFVKVGHCKRGRHQERIREQFGTSNPEQAIIKWVAILPPGKRDQHIHHQLIQEGVEKVEKSVGQEWFKASLDQVKRAYNKVCFGSQRLHSFSMRQEQRDAVTKAVKWYKNDHSEETLDGATYPHRFLLNAKMRFGKCFTGMEIAKAMQATRCLIITYKPEVISEWMEIVNDHVAFNGWLGVRARRNDSNINEPFLEEDGVLPIDHEALVVCVSLQDFNIHADGTTKQRLSEVRSERWDLVIFDEVHFGSRTERAKYIIDSLRWKKRLDLSGTPFRLIQEEDFCPQQVFTYSYIDEQRNKRREAKEGLAGPQSGTYQCMPDLDISTIQITAEDIEDQVEKFYTDDLDFSLNELFRVQSGKFAHEDAVDHFLDGLRKRTHDARAISVFGKLGDGLGAPTIRHSVWWLARVDSVRVLAKKLRSHPYFSNFEIINAAGCAKNDDGEEVIAKDKGAVEKGIKRCAKKGSFGTITLTVRRFLTGVTIKEWDSILVLNDVSSPESYYQAIFRVQSAWTDQETGTILKPKAWVFDFAITRCLRLTFHYAYALADQLDQQDSVQQVINDNLLQVAEDLCDTLNIKRFYEGALKSDKATARDIFEAIQYTGSRLSLAKRITSDALVSFLSLKHLDSRPDLLDALKRVKGYRTQQDVGGVEDFLKIGQEAEELKMNRIDRELEEEEVAGENEEFIDREKDKEKKTRKRWFATQIKRLAICMADFIYMTRFREHKIEHVIQTKEPEFFESVTGISKGEFKELCDRGFINQQALNRIVREFRCQEESSLSPEQYILENIKKVI